MPEPWTAFQWRDAVIVSGPDAVSYLQGQLSQDVAALAVGGSAWSWLLQPAGKVDALVRVTRTGPDALLVDVDAGFGAAVLTRLTRFKLRTKAQLVPAKIGVTAVRGPGAGEWAEKLASGAVLAELQAGAAPQEPVEAGPAEAQPFEAPAMAVVALWPADGEAADVLQRNGTSISAELVRRTEAAWESARIAAGVPVMGAELTEKTIPAETGLVAITASFTKGCYTGQELVARIDSRGGNVPRHLRRLRSATTLVAGDELTNAEGKAVGTVTSAAAGPDAGVVALGYVARSVGADDAIASAAGPVTVLGSDA